MTAALIKSPTLFHASDRVRATAIKGSEPRLVVSFTGTGDPEAGHQTEEFAEIAHMGGRNHVLFVTDTLCSWYNVSGTFEEILDLIESYMRNHGIKELATIGSGMGGYGAIIFAGWLGAKSCLAISAEYSADPKVVPEDTRVMDLRGQIPHFTRPPMEDMLSETCLYFVVHDAGPQEQPHWSRFPQAENIEHFLASPNEGRVVDTIEAAGKLGPVFHCAILARPVVFRRALRDVFADLRRVERQSAL